MRKTFGLVHQHAGQCAQKRCGEQLGLRVKIQIKGDETVHGLADRPGLRCATVQTLEASKIPLVTCHWREPGACGQTGMRSPGIPGLPSSADPRKSHAHG